ncbi:lipocalin-like domain-containing protein [Pseudomonas putida]|uniref:lipocalin-like domain-containing protein n=1 Tax=Pseudomonas putida TaxID=303 RepID=UPI001E4C7FED|nr:lipocalin-like domain-containing protein [Pseudomonas putida]MCE0963297.1 lipocalin-like domain-containing protein [Pseudomonas putida]
MSMREKLIGTWVLETYTEYPVDGSAPIHPFGEHPEGFIIYSADGYMSAQLSMPNRASFSSGDWFEGTDAEYRSLGLSYISYSGPFDVYEHSGELTHTIAVSMFPNWIGQVQPRTANLVGDILELGNTSQYRSSGRAVNARIRWRRANRKLPNDN